MGAGAKKSFEVGGAFPKRRLLRDYQTHGSLIVAVDFDNTIYDFHSQGLDMSRAISCVKRCIDAGFSVFVFTANSDEAFVRKVWFDMFAKDGVAINVSPLDHQFESRKPYYSILLDDRAGLDSALSQVEFVLDVIDEESCNV